MWNASTRDMIMIEEIKRKLWPEDGQESAFEEESQWEILNNDGTESSIKRHWFKQNYLYRESQENNLVTYH